MSVHRVRRGPSTAYVVRWREGLKNRQRSFDQRRDALRWDGEVRRRRQLGSLELIDASSTTLDQFTVEVWSKTHAPTLAASTRSSYARIYDQHLSPRVGQLALHAITPKVVGRL